MESRFSASCIARMEAFVTKDEIRKTILSMNNDKASGLDGFSTGFYHQAWPVVGLEMVEAIQEIFKSGKFLKKKMQLSILLCPRRRTLQLWKITGPFLFAFDL